MSCLRLEQVYLYIEEGMDVPERRMIKNHLDICPACRRAVEDRKALHEASLSLPPLEVPPEFVRTILDRIPVIRASSSAWLAALISGVGVLFLVFMGANFLIGQNISGFLTSSSRALGRLSGQSAAVLGKALEILLLGLRLAGELLDGLRKILDILLSYLLRPQTAVPALFLALLLSFLFIVGMKRILPSGEKS